MGQKRKRYNQIIYSDIKIFTYIDHSLHTEKREKEFPTLLCVKSCGQTKSDESAQNNRRVTIRKLKVLLGRNRRYRISKYKYLLGDEMQRTVLLRLLYGFRESEKLQKQSKVQVNKLYDVLHLITNGLPLPYLNQDWVDSFKSDYANYVQDMLWNIVQSGNLTDFRLLTKIADIIFSYSTLQMKMPYT